MIKTVDFPYILTFQSSFQYLLSKDIKFSYFNYKNTSILYGITQQKDTNNKLKGQKLTRRKAAIKPKP